jgi:23S rRNA-/tRNA-specific pseudouridylate synthase
MLKVILLILVMIETCIIFNFSKEYEALVDENTELDEELTKQKALLRHVAHRCESYAGKQWYNNANTGFRQIKELAENKTLDTENQSEI